MEYAAVEINDIVCHKIIETVNVCEKSELEKLLNDDFFNPKLSFVPAFYEYDITTSAVVRYYRSYSSYRLTLSYKHAELIAPNRGPGSEKFIFVNRYIYFDGGSIENLLKEAQIFVASDVADLLKNNLSLAISMSQNQ